MWPRCYLIKTRVGSAANFHNTKHVETRKVRQLARSVGGKGRLHCTLNSNDGDIAVDTQVQVKELKREVRTGLLQSMPQVAPAEEHLNSALRITRRFEPSKLIKPKSKREIKGSAQRLDTLTKELVVPLGKYVKGFPKVDKLHPFEASLLHLTVDQKKYELVLERVDILRKKMLEAGKANTYRAAKSKNPREASLVCEEGIEQLERMYKKEKATLDKLLYITKQLRRLPLVDVFVPTFVLVGAPNVGKSSLVASLSSGTPEICNYPFTTKSIKLGHFDHDAIRYQVTDTPGLLARSDYERNDMEGLTIAALEHLENTVVFVMDLTGECGTKVADQLEIRDELRDRFPEKVSRWIDVFTKADMFSEGDSELKDTEFLDKDYQVAIHRIPKALWLSTHTGYNMEMLKDQMLSTHNNVPGKD